MHRHRPTTAPTRGEQLELFAGDTPAAAAAVAAAPSTATADGAPVSTARARVTAGVPAATSSLTSWSVHGAGDRSAAESNDMALVSAVLAAADRDGYFLADPDDACWRTGTETDSATATVALVESDPAEAAMVAQLVARGWLHRGARPRRRAGTRRGKASGQRRVELDVHPVTVAAAARAAATRWSSLAAIPVQGDPGPDSTPKPRGAR